MKKKMNKEILDSEVLAEFLLPNGEHMGGIMLLHKDAPEEFTGFGILRKWQKNVAKNPDYSKIHQIEITKDKCPKCGKNVFSAKGFNGFVHKWCGGYPDCYYQEHIKTIDNNK